MIWVGEWDVGEREHGHWSVVKCFYVPISCDGMRGICFDFEISDMAGVVSYPALAWPLLAITCRNCGSPHRIMYMYHSMRPIGGPGAEEQRMCDVGGWKNGNGWYGRRRYGCMGGCD